MKSAILVVIFLLICGAGALYAFTFTRNNAAFRQVGMLVQLPQQKAKAVQTPELQKKLFEQNQLDKIHVPAGFRLDVFAQVPDARSLAVSPTGVVFVSNKAQGNVYAVIDDNKDGFADRVLVVADKLKVPNGVALKNGDLFIATINQILKISDIENNLENPPKPAIVFDGYPKDAFHGWKFIAFGPDGKLYVPVGAPCNNCTKEENVYSSITRLDVDTKQMDVIAHGIRNSVGFAWHPDTKQLWFTDNGRDEMGDDQPTDELNILSQDGLNFGFPFCHQGDIQDTSITPNKPCSDFVPPVQKLSPHAAALGMRFYTGTMFPAEYAKQIFIAEHGSWNRKTPIGYRVMLVKAGADGKTTSYEPFADGWLQPDGKVLGRPVDVAVWTDGSLLISDDKAGLVYRVSYQP